MTLGQLFELYKAEQEGKTIICSTRARYYSPGYCYQTECKISEVQLEDLLNLDEDGSYVEYYVKEDC